jgi:hypothetical protein
MNDLALTLRKNRARIITVAVLVVLFLMAVAGMSTEDWVITTLRGFSTGAVVYLVAAVHDRRVRGLDRLREA